MFYPSAGEIRLLLKKACGINPVPVLIARRIQSSIWKGAFYRIRSRHPRSGWQTSELRHQVGR
jgi:hypothetical protein